MNSINHVLLLGNLTRDPELRYTPAGTAVCQLGVALNRRWKVQAGETQQETTFVDVTVWARQAETVAAYLTKGRAVATQRQRPDVRYRARHVSGISVALLMVSPMLFRADISRRLSRGTVPQLRPGPRFALDLPVAAQGV